MLVLKNKEEILEKLGQKPIAHKAAVEGDKIVARSAGLSDGFVADGEFVAPRLGVTPQVVATLDDATAIYDFDGKNIVVSDISKATAAYTGAVEIDPAAATASTVKKFVGTTFKEVVSGGLAKTATEIVKTVTAEKDIYNVKTLSGFSFAGFLSGDENGFTLSLEGAAAWLAAAIANNNANDKLVVTLGGDDQPEPDTPTPAPETPAPAPTSSEDKKTAGDLLSQELQSMQNQFSSLGKNASDDDDDDDYNNKFSFGGSPRVVESFKDMTQGESSDDDDDDESSDDDDDEIVTVENNVTEKAEEEAEEETFTLTEEDEQLINSWIVDDGTNTTKVKLNGALKQPADAKGLQLIEWQKSTLTLIHWFEKHGFKTCTQFTKTFCGTKRSQLEAAGIRLTFIQVKGDYDRQLPYFSMNGGQKRVYFDLDANRNFAFSK